MIDRSLRRKIKVLLVWLVGMFIILLLSNHLVKKVSNNIASSLISPFVRQGNSSSLGKVIKEQMEGAKGTYSIVVKNLKNNETYYSDEHRVFNSGSLYKLWVMVEVFDKIKEGSLKLDDQLSRSVVDLNNDFNISPDVAELTEGTITMTVDSALKQMITISHNYAALLLTQKIRLSSIDKFLKDNNFKESEVGINGDYPTTTAYDIALFFEKLYKGQISDGEYTNKMFELLKAQQLNEKLPKYLPPGTSVAHKTGELDFLSHDGGIVTTRKGDYIIVVMSDSSSPEGANDRIAKISEAVYKYFNN